MGRFPAIALVVLAGCGRVGFDAQDGGGGGAGLPVTGDFTLTQPVAQTAINSQWLDTECFVLPDGLTLYFASDRMFDPGGHDVYAATRPTLDADFTNPVVLGSISSVDSEGRLVTADGYVGYYWSDGVTGLTSDIMTVTRTDLGQPFAGAGAQPVPSLATATWEYDPWPTPDGRRVYVSITDMVVGGNQALWFVERASPADAFGPPQLVSTVDTPDYEDNPALSGDERLLVFSSNRGGDHDLYYARRMDRDAVFDPPQPLPVVNTEYSESEPCITERGELLFSSDRPGGVGDVDIYRAYFIPLD